jgi:hydroxylamine dehydrogenase
MKTTCFLLVLMAVIVVTGGHSDAVNAPGCIDCHLNTTPGIVEDWKISRHGQTGLDCAVCHGREHVSAADVEKVRIPTPETCAACHGARVKEFKAGKHALAWEAMNAMPTMHWQPSVAVEGMKGCGGCHKIGIKTEEEIKALKKDSPGFGTASCDACHTRHVFSVVEARQPQACQTCHMGFDHPQWEMYSASKHGVRALLKQIGVLPENVAAPTCQTCHMQQGNHEVRTAWGFLGIMVPMPDDPEWAADRTKILQAIGALDPEGNPTGRLETIKKIQLARLTQEEWEKERSRMLAACSQCHSSGFAEAELRKGDQMIRETDRLMAEAIRIVAGLYKDGMLQKPEYYLYPFPDLLAFQDAPTPIEIKLFIMFLEHRNRAFQGTFHINPDYAWWYGYSAMRRHLTEIEHMAEEMRRASRQASR